MKKKGLPGKIFSFILVLLVIVFFINSIAGYTSFNGNKFASPSIVVINVDGIILNSDKFISVYRKFVKNKNVKGFILRVNSPGGAVAPSQEIYNIIRKIDKPVYVSMSTLAASGGYYISSAADKIFALPGTLTGSIGVIMKFSDFNELYDKIGIDFKTIKSGKFKDIGSPEKELSKDEIQILQKTVDQVYESFISDILSARNIDENVLRKYADGRIITGVKAKEIGLIDDIGDFYDVVESLKQRLAIPGLKVHHYKEDKNPLDSLISGFSYIKNFLNGYEKYKYYYLNDKI